MQQRALIVGMGVSGKAALALLEAAGGWHCITYDDATSGEHPDPATCDLVVVSPGVTPTHPLLVRARSSGVELVSEVELALRYRQKHQRFIGVTGTNGKSSVTLLITTLLQAAGIAVRAAGNIGRPLSEEMGASDPHDCFVVELSSYQLEELAVPAFDVGLLLNISPDHLERHGTMEAYVSAKAQLGCCVKSGGVFLVEQQARLQFHSHFDGYDVTTFGDAVCNYYHLDGKGVYRGSERIAELPPRQGHHPLNIVAACAVCDLFGVEPPQSALNAFTLPEHRMEFVCDWKGVRFYNDSKATNVEAVAHAVGCLKGGIVLIVGGVDKGGEYLPWIKEFSGKVKGICAIGEAADKIEQQLISFFPVALCGSLEEAVVTASTIAVAGESILLSPGCASFDMFDDYVQRGCKFKEIVNHLVQEGL